MKNAKMKKIIISIVSALAVTFTASAMSACTLESAHPEAQITYEFNGKTYEVNYTLYRNMYPHTVRHFIELADAKFYDNTVIHNYATNDWFAGNYEYNAEAYAQRSGNAGQMAEYFEEYSKEDAYVQLQLTPSVYNNIGYGANGAQQVNREDALNTVMGEFYNNIHQTIEHGALSADYGCLKMFYYDKQTTQKVVVTPTNDQLILADYKYNSATSVFALQTGTSSSYSERNYTVFAALNGTESFDDFVDAVREYISDNHSGTASEFYTIAEARVDNNDNFTEKPETDKGITVNFNAPNTPIIIKSVKITRY